MTTSQNSAQATQGAWLDEEFKSSLEKAPAVALKEQRMEPDVAGPALPCPDDLSDESLDENIKFPATMRFSHCARGAVFCFSDAAMAIKNKALTCN